jgi:FKBP-type peptidyl-prolyl cis-trans isomerase
MKTMNRNKWIAVGAGIVVATVLLFGDNIVRIFTGAQQSAVINSTMEESNGTGDLPSANEFVIEDVVVGTGAEAKAGDVLTVNYTGALTNGQVFDSSVGRQPFQFKLGAGDVIRGWEEGFSGMKVGGKRRLILPPQYAYGAQQAGPIPPNSTLIFEVELLDVSQQ